MGRLHLMPVARQLPDLFDSQVFLLNSGFPYTLSLSVRGSGWEVAKGVVHYSARTPY